MAEAEREQGQAQRKTSGGPDASVKAPATAEDDTAAQERERAAAEDAKRKALEAELARKSEETQRRVAEVNQLTEQGKSRAAAGNLSAALASFEKAAAALPDGEKAFAAQKLAEMAESLYEIAKNSTDSTVRNEALASALDYANRAIEADPSLASAHYVKARVLAEQGKQADALAEMREASRLDPKNWLYLYELGKLQYVQSAIRRRSRASRPSPR
jgi:tetratricopeptide (TPR) repeat protein